jgi:hypothetical protein
MYTVLMWTVLMWTVLMWTVLMWTVLMCTVLMWTVLMCIVLMWTINIYCINIDCINVAQNRDDLAVVNTVMNLIIYVVKSCMALFWIYTSNRVCRRQDIWISFIHLVVCLMTGPKLLPKLAPHIGRSRAFSFKWEYPLLFLRSSSSFQRLLPRHPVTSIPPFIFPSITRYRRQFLRKMWPIQLGFRLLISAPWL